VYSYLKIWGPPSLLFRGYWGLCPQGKSSWGMKLTAHLHSIVYHHGVRVDSLSFALISYCCLIGIPYILESNPHPLYGFRGLKNQMRITIACGLDSRTRAGFWKNDGATIHAVRTIQYNNLLFYLLLIVIYSSYSPSSLITESLSVLRRDCTRLLRKIRFTVPV
jgi:hypothetical protein